MINSRQKGARGEREFAAYLRDRGIVARRGQQFSGGTDSPDVVHNFPGIHFEVKRVETLNLKTAMEQAKNDAGEKMPVVAHKKNRQEWVAILSMDDFMKLLLNCN
jgi:Holliday junction resolvase